jgi:hypothetical protein
MNLMFTVFVRYLIYSTSFKLIVNKCNFCTFETKNIFKKNSLRGKDNKYGNNNNPEKDNNVGKDNNSKKKRDSPENNNKAKLDNR